MTDSQTPYASTVRTCIETLMEQGARLSHYPLPHGAPTAEIFGDSFSGIPADSRCHRRAAACHAARVVPLPSTHLCLAFYVTP